MAIKFVKGKTRLREFTRTASVTFTKNSLCILTSGLVATALNNTTTTVLGIVVEDVASTDSDFATAAVPIKVELPADANCVVEADVANGSLLTTSIGVKFGLTSAGAVDFADTTDVVLTCVGFISASKGLFQLDESALFSA